MKRFPILQLAAVIFLTLVVQAADSVWQTGRIVNISQATNSRTTTWLVNTPITQEDTVCTISVQVADRIYTGSYVVNKSRPLPPQEWQKSHPVRVQFAGDYVYVKVPASEDLKVKVSKRRQAPMMAPLTPQELATQKTEESLVPAESLIGFDKSAPPKPQAPEQPAVPDPAPTPPPPEAATGTVSVSSVPYLADLYVDGQDVGYTPAKLKLPPGKHTFRCEKKGYEAWTKEITVTVGSELTLDATLTAHK